LEECWPCPVFANYTLAFALQEGKAWKNLSQGSQRDSKYTHYQDTRTLQNPPIHTHSHVTKQFKPPQYKLKQTHYEIYPNVAPDRDLYSGRPAFACLYCWNTLHVCLIQM
jgi:hypothetical protein